MNTIKTLPCILAMVFAASASAKVSIEVPSNVDMLVVDGAKPHETGSFLSATKTIELEDGQHQILFRYEPVFSEGQERYSTESDPIVATFTATNESLSFQLPKYRDIKDAEKNIKSMQWSLTDESGNAVSVKQDKLIKEGMQIGRNFRDEIDEYNRSGRIASVGVVQPEINYTSAPAPAPAAKPRDNTAEQMLHFWYNKADAQTRSRFKAYLNKN